MPSQLEMQSPHSMPEVVLLRALWRWLWLTVLLAALAGTGIYYWSKNRIPQYRADSELLMRYGYEYTPPSAGNNSDSMQVRVDVDLAISSDIQILASPAVLLDALKHAPPPGKLADRIDGWESLSEFVSISRIPSSNVVKIEVTSEDGNWARSYAEAIVQAYFARRSSLFSADPVRRALEERLQDDKREFEAAKAKLHDKLVELGEMRQELAKHDIAAWAALGKNLIQLNGRNAPEDPQGQANSQQPPDPKLAIIGRLLDDVLSSAPSGVAGAPVQSTAVSMAKAEAVQLETDLLAKKVEADAASVEETQGYLQRLELRNALDKNITILTDAQLSSRPVGPTTVQMVVLAVIGAALASIILSFVIEATVVARRNRRRLDDNVLHAHFGQSWNVNSSR